MENSIKVGGWDHPIPQGFSNYQVKPYIKAVTHSEEVEWWRTLMVECVTVSRLYSQKRVTHTHSTIKDLRHSTS